MLQSFSEVCEHALVIKDPIPIGWTFDYCSSAVIEIFRPDINFQYDHMFKVENGVIAFVMQNALYVIPATSNIKEIVGKEKILIIQDKIIVPFSHGEFPVKPNFFKVWSDLMDKAYQNQL